MVTVYLSNGFGNNIFQYVAGRLLANHHDTDLQVIPPFKNYHAITELAKINIHCSNEFPNASGDLISCKDYPSCFTRSTSKNFHLKGYFEDYKHYYKNIDLIKSWFPKTNTMQKNILSFHFRTGDRLLSKNEFKHKPSAENIVKAIDNFDFDELHIISDMPFWKKITVEDLNQINSGKTEHKWLTTAYDTNGKLILDKSKMVELSRSVDYFNSVYDALSLYQPIFKKRSVADDFIFLKNSKNILFEHGTLSWWAAFLSDAEKVGVYGPWRCWKSNNKNLSDVPFINWFKWN